MIKLIEIHCERCYHRWEPRSKKPKRCPHCGSLKWDISQIFGKEDRLVKIPKIFLIKKSKKGS